MSLDYCKSRKEIRQMSWMCKMFIQKSQLNRTLFLVNLWYLVFHSQLCFLYPLRNIRPILVIRLKTNETSSSSWLNSWLIVLNLISECQLLQNDSWITTPSDIIWIMTQSVTTLLNLHYTHKVGLKSDHVDTTIWMHYMDAY